MPSCKNRNWVELDKDYCPNYEFIINKPKLLIDRKLLEQGKDFSSRLPSANKKIRKVSFSTVKTKYNTTEDMNNIFQVLKSKTKLKFQKNMRNYYDQMSYMRQSGEFHLKENFFRKGA